MFKDYPISDCSLALILGSLELLQPRWAAGPLAMNTVYVSVLAVALALSAPGILQAQPIVNGAPLSRDQIKQQLKDLRAAGYDPGDWGHYPGNIQSALHRLNDANNRNSNKARIN